MSQTIGAELDMLHREISDLYKYAYRSGQRADEKRLDILWRRVDQLEDDRRQVVERVVFK